ncbi:hypothetical protein MSMEI_6554 [Mycolicibacterium smegmatis MC2 155]|uniref:Uncharacterized protein n=1 Tax=Mycolicibacterium smegmatis (strain ATCC 700084 / mc(2)155) TaxID=246196 RepID=I7FNX1_MYCS2|nr:hypothetical protein MSMEI_6554 [Mycolicibacterium smegmatis MC2 155]
MRDIRDFPGRPGRQLPGHGRGPADQILALP